MRKLTIYIDLVFCFVVLPVMIIMFPIERWYHNFQSYVISLGIWLYCLYFINRYITVPGLFSGERKKLVSCVIIIASFIITYLFSAVSLYSPPPNIYDTGIVKLLPKVKQYQQAVWSLFMIVQAFSFAVSLLIQTEFQRDRRREAEARRDRAEIDLYKAQIKPHFMFNTLNSLYGLFLTNNKNALPSLEKFISMMRYIHTTATKQFVTLADETDYIRRLVGLQSLRLNEKTKVVLDIDITDSSLLIPPMLLVTFVENCFKHGISPVEQSTINISIIEKNAELHFHTRNRIFPVKRIGEHMGIDNCRKRLILSYPKSHKLSINNCGNFFDVELVINLSL